MSIDRSHPPHTRARLSQAGLIATGIVGSALAIGLVSSAPAAPSTTPPATHTPTPEPQTQGVGVTAQRVADAAESVVTTTPPIQTGVQIAAEVRHQTAVAQYFYNTLSWDAVVAKNLAFEKAVAAAEFAAAVKAAQANAAAAAAAAPTPGGSMPSSVAGMFSCIRNAESGGDYSAVNASSGAGGAYQFMPSTWASLGGAGLPQDAPPAEQDAMALKLYQRDGWSPWAGDSCVG